MTLKRIVQKLGAKAKANIPIMLLVKPIGKAKGVGFLSVYVPIIGCITEAIIFKVKVINPNRVNERLSDFSKMGNIAGMTACKESFNKCDALIIKSMR